MKALITFLLTAVIACCVICQETELCSDEVNQSGFFLRKCAILPENTFGGSDNAVKSGVTFQYLIWFTIPEGATGVAITDIIPTELEIVNAIPPDAVIDHITNTVTYEVPDGTAANTAQSLAINVKFPPGITCSGTTASNKVEISADQLEPPLSTDEIDIQAFAVNPFVIFKSSTLPLNTQTNIYEGVVGQSVTYNLLIYKPTGYYYSSIGQQDLVDIFVYDILPENATLYGNVLCDGVQIPANLDPINGLLELDCSGFTLSGATLTPSLFCVFQVDYPEEFFPLGSIINNEAYYTGNSCGDIDPVYSNTIHVQFGEASPGNTASKSVSINNPVSGCVGNYWLNVSNSGNVLLDNYTIEDVTPADVEITGIKLFRSTLDPAVPITLTIGNSDPVVFNNVPNHQILFPNIEITEFPSGGTFNIQRGNEDHPVEIGLYCKYQIEFRVKDDLQVGHSITNTASFTFSFENEPSEPTTAQATFEIEEFQPKVCLYKTVCNPQNSYMYGDIIKYRFTIQNNGSGLLNGANIEDLLHSSLEYTGNEMYYYSETLNPPCSENGTIPQGATEWTGVTENHTSNNLKWESIEIEPYCEVTNIWTANGCNPTGITYYFIEFDAIVRQDAPAGTISNFFTMSGGGLVSEAESEVAHVTINNVFGVTAEKFASKDNGLSWHKSLEINQNDEVMYRLQFTNNSNYPVTDIVLMDLLPMNYSSSDDRMILDRDNNRGSQFGILYNDTDIPEIATNPENLNFSLPLVLVDNNDNICTAELLYSPDGCIQPDWQGGTGKNVKFDFGTENILPPGATLNCDFKIQIPESTPSGLMACNSFAVRSSGFFTIGGETITVDNIASESDVICLNYSQESGNDLLCEEPVFFWTEQAGGDKNDLDYAWGNAVVTDPDKNVYTTGGFSGTVNFPNGSVFSSTGAESKIFVAKQNEAGDFLWITEFGDIGFNEGRSIAISPTGEVFVTGIKSFLYSFDDDVIPEAFVAKIDGTNGELILDPVIGFSYWPSAGNDIAIGMDGKVYITGYECTWLKGDNSPKTSYCGWDDILMRIFDQDLLLISNQYINIGGNGVDVGNGIAVDQNGYIYITGFFEQTVNFNPDWQGTPTFKTAIGGRDIFLIKFDQNFEVFWVATIGGEEEDISSDIVIDESGDVYITGWVSKSSVNVAGFDIPHNPAGICDGFVSKWTSGGNCEWTQFMESENSNSFSKGFSIDIGPDEEKVFTTGLFSGVVNFNPDNPDPLTAQFEDMFILKLATVDGGYLLNLINESLNDNGILPGVHSIVVDENGCLYTTGNFIEADFDPNPANNFNATSTSMKDIFVQKLCCCCPNEADFLNRIDKGFKVEIDPVNCRVTVTLDQFNACHLMAYSMPDWDDGTTMQPMLSPANGEWSHDYDQSGEYEICATIYEYDEDGDFCYSGLICTIIEIDCFYFECDDITICCTDPPVWLSENAPDGAIFSGEFVTEVEGEFYFTPNCDDFPPPTPPYPGLYKEYDISYEYSDVAGNTYNCYFTIIVDADTPPSPDCPPLDTIVCINTAPFWHGMLYIDPAELGVGTHYFDCFWTNACGSWGWDWITNPPAPQVRRKVTVLAANANGYAIPDTTVCENDPPFWHWGYWIVPNQLNIGNNTIPYGENAVPPEIYKDPCGNIINGTFNVKVLSWLQCPLLHPIDFPDYPWHIVSSYLQPITPDPSPVPSPIIDIFEPEIYLGHFEYALGKNGILWPSGSINTLGNWDVYQGYKIKMNEPGWIELTGEIPEDKTITLDAGANYIPVLSQEFYPAMDIFGQLGEGLIFAFDLNTELLYWPQGGINSLQVLEPGKGYLVGMTQPGQATYEPLVKGGVENHTPAQVKVYKDAPWSFVRSGSPHLISIDRSALTAFAPEDFIGVFNAEGICAGMSQIDNSRNNLLLVAYGNDFTVETITGFGGGESMQFKVYRASAKEESQVFVTFDASMPNMGLFAENGLSKITKIKTGATTADEYVQSDIQIYPNPTQGAFTIEGIDKKINVRIFNAFGEEVYLHKLTLPAEVDLSDRSKGIYFIRIDVDEIMFFEKLIIN